MQGIDTGRDGVIVDETQGRPRWSKSRREGGLGDAKQAARLLRSLDSADIRSALRGSFAGSRPAFQGFSTRHAPLPSPGSGLAHRAAEPKKSPASDGIGHGKCTGPGLSRGLSACAAIAGFTAGDCTSWRRRTPVESLCVCRWSIPSSSAGGLPPGIPSRPLLAARGDRVRPRAPFCGTP